MSKLQNVMEANKKLSLRKIAQATEVSYLTLLKASKAPVEGEVYDPNVVNYQAIEAKLIEKMGQEAFEAYDWESLVDMDMNIKVELSGFEQGDLITLKNPGYSKKYTAETVYTIILMTETHVVLMPNDSTEPRVLSNGTLKICGPRLVK